LTNSLLSVNHAITFLNSFESKSIDITGQVGTTVTIVTSIQRDNTSNVIRGQVSADGEPRITGTVRFKLNNIKKNETMKIKDVNNNYGEYTIKIA